MNANNISPIPFRLVIGVTGHRTLSNVDELRETVRKVLDDISIRYKQELQPEYTDIKLAILSPLAEGADRLVAEEVLNYQETAILKAILPLEKNEYLEDFKTDDSKKEFEILLEKARDAYTLRDRKIANDYRDLSELMREARRNAYEDVGRFVVDHSDVVIAIWDGKEPQSHAGTGAIVEYAKKSECPLYIINPLNPSFDNPTEGSRMTKDLCSRIDTYNKDLKNAADQGAYIEKQSEDLFREKEIETGNNGEKNLKQLFKETAAKISEDVKNCVKNEIIPYYTVTSSITKSYQRMYKLTGQAAYWLALSAVMIVGLAVVFLHDSDLFIYAFALEAVLLLVISILIWRANKKRSHKKWMEYRFLAERLRTSFFLYISGVPIDPVFIKRKKDESSQAGNWMLLAFEEIWHRIPKRTPCGTEGCHDVGAYIKMAWIEDQIAYHTGNTQKCIRKSSTYEKWGERVFVIAIIAAIAHIFFHQSILTLVSLILPALAATFESLRTHHEYRRLASRSKKVSGQLRDVESSFRLLNPEKLIYLVKRSDQIMLNDTQEWMELMSPVELHKVV